MEPAKADWRHDQRCDVPQLLEKGTSLFGPVKLVSGLRKVAVPEASGRVRGLIRAGGFEVERVQRRAEVRLRSVLNR